MIYLINLTASAATVFSLVDFDLVKHTLQESWEKTWQAIEDVILNSLPETPSMHRWSKCAWTVVDCFVCLVGASLAHRLLKLFLEIIVWLASLIWYMFNMILPSPVSLKYA